jgi:ferredoxin
MCNFCVQHGEGKRWYANARNYAFDLRSDLGRRGYVVDFVRGFERNRRSANAGLAALRFLPRPIAEPLREGASAGLRERHFGQPVPIEECERIFDLATNITRIPCVCRGAMRPGSDAESCCIVMTVAPHDDLLAECFRDYRGGPDAEGFEKLTKEQAVAYLRRAERRGLCHTAWTFQTPFIAALCNCDLPSGCMAMKIQLRGGVRIMWKGEDVIARDRGRCNDCGACVLRCPFGALRLGPRGEVGLDRTACWGCGTCRASCAHGALALEPRAAAPDVAALW